jgi:hypothetical protein
VIPEPDEQTRKVVYQLVERYRADPDKCIAEVAEQYGSLERFHAEFEEHPAVKDLRSKLTKAGAELFNEAWRTTIERFLEVDYWDSLTTDPKVFNAELDKQLAKVRGLVKLFYGVKSGRPERNAERNKEIYEENQNGRSFGEIATKRGMKRNAVERACKFHQDRERKRLQASIRYFLDLIERASSRGAI